MKKYLIALKSKDGRTSIHIGANTDNLKPIFIYFNLSDSGERYINIGNASRWLKKLAAECAKNGIEYEEVYGTANDIPVYGSSEWNKALFRYQYCKKPFPNVREYFGY